MGNTSFRFRLMAKKDMGTILKGEIITIFNDIVDPDNGVLLYPIEIENWDIISYDNFTGQIDKNLEMIYENDTITNGKATFTLVWDNFQWICEGHGRENKSLNELSNVILEKYEKL